MKSIDRSKLDTLCFVLALLLVGYYFWAKLLLYRNLEYTSDLFAFLQISRTWVEKGLLMMENSFGGIAPVHSYFSTLLAYPLTATMGAAGLFLYYALPLIWALWESKTSPLPLKGKVFLYGLLLGPHGFWLWDDYVYGYHQEVFYFPLALVFMLRLSQQGRSYWPAVAALCLVREDGPIVACGVYFAYQAFVFATTPTPFALKKTLQFFAIMFALFVGHFAWLKLQASFYPDHPALMQGRIQSALNSLIYGFQDPPFRAQYWRMLKYLCALPLLCFLLLKPNALGIKLSLIWLMSVSPLIIINYVGAAASHPNVYEAGLTWPGRAAPALGIALGLVYLLFLRQKTFKGTWVGICLVLATAGSFYILIKDRNYFAHHRIFPFAYQDRFAGRFFDEEQLQAYRCLSEKLSKRTPLATDTRLFSLFERHDLVWPGREEVSNVEPVIYVCDLGLKKRERSVCIEAAERSGLKRLSSKGENQIYSKQAGIEDTITLCQL